VAPPPATAAISAPPPSPMFGNLFSSERRDGVSPFVRELWGAHSAGLVQPASAPAGLPNPSAVQPGAIQASAPISAVAVTAPPAVGGTAFQFLRPDVGTNQGSWPI